MHSVLSKFTLTSHRLVKFVFTALTVTKIVCNKYVAKLLLPCLPANVKMYSSV